MSDIYTETERRPHEVIDEGIPVNVPQNEDAQEESHPIDIPEGTVPVEEAAVYFGIEKPIVKKSDISNNFVKKDWPGNRCYLYGLTSEYYPIVYRYILKQSLNVGTIKHVVDDINRDYPNVVFVYIVDNSKDIHEAFNRARTKYRPSEDRAIFKCMLEDKGIKLIERAEDK